MEQAVSGFRASVVGDYELDAEIVDQLCNLFQKNAALLLSEKAVKVKKAADEKPVKPVKPVKPASEKAEKSEKPATEKAPRKKSAYNLFVKEKMQDETIKSLNHKDKMKRIAEMWQTCDKETYTKMAAELGDVDTLTIVTTQ
jgi:hypothetical protein